MNRNYSYYFLSKTLKISDSQNQHISAGEAENADT
jgi:hypothetical protein